MLTADRMVAAGIRLRDIPLGDPGLLAGEVLASDRIAQIAPIVVVPATGNQRHPFFSTLRDSREIQIVNLDTDSLDPLRAIAGADCVVSQDVYGLVYAAAFGKPAVWIADRSDAEHDFRFRDLMSTMCEKIDRPILLGGSVEILARYAARVNYQRSIQALADCIQSLPHQDKS